MKKSRLSAQKQNKLIEHFGGRRKGKPSRGATGKAPLFGLLKRSAKGI